jgi:hypothetical protein
MSMNENRTARLHALVASNDRAGGILAIRQAQLTTNDPPVIDQLPSVLS